jgi:hypothetical protein
VGVTLQNLVDAGIVKPPLDLARKYRGRELKARVERDGRVTCLGQSCDSLSSAGGLARASVIGMKGEKNPPTNGWTFWTFAGPDEKHRPVDGGRVESEAPASVRDAKVRVNFWLHQSR